MKELAKRHDDLPVDALNAALEQPDAVAPLFEAEIDRLIGQFEEILENAKSDRQYASLCKKLLRKPSALFYGFLLAAEWRRTEAYPRYASLLQWSWAGEPNLLSETVFSDVGPRVMAEIYDGNPVPLFNLLLDHTAHDSIRFWQFRTLIILVIKGELDMPTLKAFLVRAFDELEQEPEQHVWRGWEEVIIYFGLEDLIPLVERAHNVQRILEGTIEEFRANYAYARAHPDEPIENDPVVPFKGLQEELNWAFANRASLD
ncbi:hypothetical protein CCR94_18310 [Rhodoblastus sphagnicola]|uniref:DUF1186 domain-containing protein n=2 Tax=Rhodoblastus sphagnicola TaxID=333368 RepID=A0A2S6N0U1_9HYPH|nr:hypothetical protein CCR94_18310 [Rhodoblastus sphagnicola]